MKWIKTKVGERKYDLRFNYYRCGNFHQRRVKLWWSLLFWLGNRYFLRYGIDQFLNLFIKWKGETLKQRWIFWGGGGKVNWWIRRNITFE